VHGGRECLEAISFIKRFNEAVYQHHPDVQTMAEESTAWPMSEATQWRSWIRDGGTQSDA
jgi:1,4-alpha-glucan branching enzyme